MSAKKSLDETDRLVAVVVTYNRLDKLKVTLAQLLAAPGRPTRQLVPVRRPAGANGNRRPR